LLPDVIKVIALAQGCDNRQGANPPPAGTAGLSMLIAWCMGVKLEQTMTQGWQNGRPRSETNEQFGEQEFH
jgi:hypothetical protein